MTCLPISVCLFRHQISIPFGLGLLISALLTTFGPVSPSSAQTIEITSATLEEVNQAFDEGRLTS